MSRIVWTCPMGHVFEGDTVKDYLLFQTFIEEHSQCSKLAQVVIMEGNKMKPLFYRESDIEKEWEIWWNKVGRTLGQWMVGERAWYASRNVRHPDEEADHD